MKNSDPKQTLKESQLLLADKNNKLTVAKVELHYRFRTSESRTCTTGFNVFERDQSS